MTDDMTRRLDILEAAMTNLATAHADDARQTREIIAGLHAALLDLHQVVIGAGLQTRQTAVDRLRTHANEWTDAGAPSTSTDVLEAIARGLEDGALPAADFLTTPVAGQA